MTMSTQRIQFLLPFATLVAALMSSETAVAFAPSGAIAFSPRSTVLWSSSTEASTDAANADATAKPAAGNFIGTEMRKAAMKLHNFKQSPKEGGVEAPKEDKYVPTQADYLSFLVNSQHVYEALEEIVNAKPELACFRNTGMERTLPLESDIVFMMQEYGLTRPEPGMGGKGYAQKLRDMAAVSIPEFVCHYYNFSFAHTAGGRMIGKQMSALLLDKKELEFYKYDGDLDEIKASIKNNIEDMAASWTEEERQECVAGTPGAFKGGGSINSYLSGGPRCPM